MKTSKSIRPNGFEGGDQGFGVRFRAPREIVSQFHAIIHSPQQRARPEVAQERAYFCSCAGRNSAPIALGLFPAEEPLARGPGYARFDETDRRRSAWRRSPTGS